MGILQREKEICLNRDKEYVKLVTKRKKILEKLEIIENNILKKEIAIKVNFL